MIDKTTEGYRVTVDEIEGMLRNLCGYALSEPEALRRYVELTSQQVLFDGVVAAIRRERGRALAELAADGVPVAAITAQANLASPQQVRSLVSGAGLTMPRAKTPPRSRRSPAATVQPVDGVPPPDGANDRVEATGAVIGGVRDPDTTGKLAGRAA